MTETTPHHGADHFTLWGCLAWIVGWCYEHGPSWTLLAPILIACAQLVKEWRSLRNDLHRNQLETERQRAELAERERAARSFLPKLESPN